MQCFSAVSIRRKWNGAWLLLIKWYIRGLSQVVKQFQIHEFRNLRCVKNLLIWVEAAQRPVSLSEGKIVNITKRVNRNRSQSVLLLSNFAWFLEFVSSILFGIVESSFALSIHNMSTLVSTIRFYLTGDMTNLYPFIQCWLEWPFSASFSANVSLWNHYKYIAFNIFSWRILIILYKILIMRVFRIWKWLCRWTSVFFCLYRIWEQ